MGLGRRKAQLDDPAAWVFNRMADVYDARPPYPAALVDAIAALARPGAQVVDLGAGIGHLALPLAGRGYRVCAVEPALAMLERLRERAQVAVETLHAKAEQVPLVDGCAALVVIADALHFVDAELTGREVGRLLAPHGALALVSCEFDDTPFMNALTELMREAAPRRPRETAGTALQLAALAGVDLDTPQVFLDATPLSPEQLERVLRSISFIGPAMNAARFSAFGERVHALPHAVWARRFVLQAGRRR